MALYCAQHGLYIGTGKGLGSTSEGLNGVNRETGMEKISILPLCLSLSQTEREGGEKVFW